MTEHSGPRSPSNWPIACHPPTVDHAADTEGQIREVVAGQVERSEAAQATDGLGEPREVVVAQIELYEVDQLSDLMAQIEELVLRQIEAS